MFERISLKLGELVSELKREEGQGATEYAMVIGFLIVGLTLGLGVAGRSGSTTSSSDVADALAGLIRRRRRTRTARRERHASRSAQRRTGLRTSLSSRPRPPHAGAPGAFVRRRSELPRQAASSQRAGPGGGRVRHGRAAALPDHHRDPPLREGHELLARPEPRRQRGSAQGGGQHVRQRRRVRHLRPEPARDDRAPHRRHELDPGPEHRSTSACRRAATSATR